MSCKINPEKVGVIARITGGISRLSSMQAFAVGVGTGAGGTAVAAALIANRRRIIDFFRRQKTGTRRPISLATGVAKKPAPVPVPGLGSRPTPIPDGTLRGSVIPVPGLGSRPTPIPVPGLGNKPAPIPDGTLRGNAIPVPGLGTGGGTFGSQTQLQPASIRIRGSDGATSQTNGYEVLRPSGGSTGLAITPYQPGNKNGNASSNEKVQAWGVTHMNTGMLIDGPFDSVTEAHGLANQLSPLRWTVLSVPQQDVTKAQQIVTHYRQSLLADKQ